MSLLNKNTGSAMMLVLLVLGAANGRAQSATTTTTVTTTAVTSGSSTNPTYLHDIQPLFLGKCARCHNEEGRFLPNWADYKSAYKGRLEIKRRVWDAWKGNYYKQAMPAGNCPECQTITEADRALIRDWVNSGAALGVEPTTGGAKSKAERIQLGTRLFTTMCATCHQTAGQGIANKYPPLAGSDLLNADKKEAIRWLLHGRQGEIVVNGKTYNNIMPAFPLSDEDIANALTYTYNSFGNSGKEVTPEEVKALRGEKVVPQPVTKPANAAGSQFE